MCGIYGELQLAPDREARESFRASAERALRHRGPDGAGVWSDERCLLGHTRLAILDTSSDGAQPMLAASGASCVVFNGELYNFVELRAELPPPVGGWRSHGDTEVLVEALDRRGIAALDSAIGMFAVAVWRPAERELWLLRDRLGKKPLYWARTPGGGLRFASEIGALLADGVVPRRTTHDRLAEYLQHGYVAAPRTGLAGVEAVPPGCFVRARMHDDGRLAVETARWWRLPEAKPLAGPREFREAFDATLRDAVRIRLRSDVPLGAFLSGGVDSSVVSLLASRQLGAPLRTFTVDFDEAGYSEGPFAAEVARHLGAEHTVLRVTPGAFAALPEQVVATYGDLHGDSSAIPTVALCREARAHVTVALAGDGGDELLGGYTRYARTLRIARAASRLPRALAGGVRLVGRRLLPWWMRGAGWLGRFGADPADVYVRELWAYGPHRWPQPLRRPAQLASRGWPDAVARALDEHRARSPLLRLMASDVATYLPEDILVKVDRASMAHGLEVRAPLLDHRLIELTMRAEPSWIERKAPLRAIYGPQLPPSVFARPKHGFSVPLARWLPATRLAAERLLDPSARVAAVLDPRETRRLVENRGRNEAGRIWQLLVLHAWFERWRPIVDDPQSAFAP